MATDYTTEIKAYIEQYCNIKLTSTSITEYHEGGNQLLITQFKIDSITSITNTSSATVKASTAYDFYPEEGGIYLESGEDWDEGRRLWKIIYVSGGDGIPSDLQLAITLWNAHLNENPDGAESVRIGDYAKSWGSGMDVPSNVLRILNSYRRWLM